MHTLVAVLTDQIIPIDDSIYKRIRIKESDEFVETIEDGINRYLHKMEMKRLYNILYPTADIVLDDRLERFFYENVGENDGFSYDWYIVGGRWHKYLDKFMNTPINLLDDLDGVSKMFNGYIDTDNNYHDVIEWWTIENEDIKLKKQEEFAEYLKNNGDLYIVPVDFHI